MEIPELRSVWNRSRLWSERWSTVTDGPPWPEKLELQGKLNTP